MAGDVVALIKILKAAGSALKSSGGAAEDFQQTVEQLEAQVAVLEMVANDKSTAGNAVYANAIRAQAQSLERKVNDILAAIQPYDGALGVAAIGAKKDSVLRATLQKIKWATSTSRHAERLQRKYDTSFASTQALLSLNSR